MWTCKHGAHAHNLELYILHDHDKIVSLVRIMNNKYRLLEGNSHNSIVWAGSPDPACPDHSSNVPIFFSAIKILKSDSYFKQDRP